MWKRGWGSQQGASGLVLLLFSYLGLAGTLYMTGIAWFVQLVHYPLLGRNSSNDFAAFARAYQRGTLWVVIPGLAAELISAPVLIWLWPSLQSWLGLILLGGIWTLTITCLIPDHLALKQGYCEKRHAALVRFNLPRAWLWTLRSLIMLWTCVSLQVVLPEITSFLR